MSQKIRSFVIIGVTRDGKRITKHVEHAIGSVGRPLSNEQLNTKFVTQAKPVIGEARTAKLLELSWNVKEIRKAEEIARASVPA